MIELESILERMKQYETLDDTEKAHDCADNLLIELVKYLKDKNHNNEESVKINEIINAYESIEKWYA